MRRSINLSPSTVYSFVSENASTNGYLMPDRSLPQSTPLGGAKYPFEQDLESAQTLVTSVEIWKQRSGNARNFYLIPDPDLLGYDATVLSIRRFLNDITLDELIGMLESVRKREATLDTRLEDVAPPMEHISPAYPVPRITIETLINQLDHPFRMWLNDEIDETKLREFYRDENVPIFDSFQVVYRNDFNLAVTTTPPPVPHWILYSLLFLLLCTGLVIGLRYACHDGSCLVMFQPKKTIGYENKTLPLLINGEHDYLRETTNGIMLVTMNGSLNEMKVMTIGVNSSSLSRLGDWKESKQPENDCEFIENKENCSIFHSSSGKSDRKLGTFVGDKAFPKVEHLYLFKCENDCETRTENPSTTKPNHVLFKWNSDGSKLIPFGSLQRFLAKKKLPFWDALVDIHGKGLLFLGEAGKMELCAVTLSTKRKPVEFVVEKCHKVGKLPCSTKKCTYTMRRWSASYYLFISEPTDSKEPVYVSYYDKEKEKVHDRRIEAVIPVKDRLYLKRDHEPFMICYIEEKKSLLCRVYEHFDQFPHHNFSR